MLEKMNLEMDTERYITEKTNSMPLCRVLCTAYYEYYLELLHMMSPLIPFHIIYLPLFYKTIFYKRAPYNKKFAVSEAIYYNKETYICFLK